MKKPRGCLPSWSNWMLNGVCDKLEYRRQVHVNSAHPVWSRRVHSWSRPLPCWSLARADSTGSSSVCRKSPPGPACPLAHRTRFECRHRQTSTLAVKTCCRRLHVVYTCTCRLCSIYLYVTTQLLYNIQQTWMEVLHVSVCIVLYVQLFLYWICNIIQCNWFWLK